MAENNAPIRWENLKYYDAKMDEVIQDINDKLGAGGYTIDSELSETSTNSVQNKVITEELNKKINASDLADWVKTENKPEYTASDVGADPVGSASTAKAEANTYTDEKVAALINGAPTTLDTLKEIADAMAENEDVVEALEAAIGDKANKDDIPTSLPANGGNAATVGGYTLGGNVTANDIAKLGATNIAYGTCSTAAATAAKVITISGNTNWKLATGSMITVKFTNTNTAENPTFNVNNTGAKKVWYNTALITTNGLGYAGTANRLMNFIYDGTQYVFIGWSFDYNTTYSNMGAATASTAGKSGLVPAPAAGAQTKFLRGDGLWEVPTQIKTTTTVPTVETDVGGTIYYPTIVDSNNATSGAESVYTIRGIHVNARLGTGDTNTYGDLILALGNSIDSSEAENARGIIALYNKGTHYTQLTASEDNTADYHLSLPSIDNKVLKARCEGTKTGDEILNDYSGNTASGEYSLAAGRTTEVTARCAVALGEGTKISGKWSTVEGYKTTNAVACSHVMGCYNKVLSGSATSAPSTNDALVIGNGTNTALGNAFRVTMQGAVYGLSAFNSSGADYAEFIKPWHDGNPDKEDRVGYFVTIKDGFLHKASEGDYIIGITSGNPSIIGNADEDYYWKYARDEFNRFILEDYTEEIEESLYNEDGSPVLDEDGNIVTETVVNVIKNGKLKINDSYDNTLQKDYIERKNRPEWSCVGMIGVIPVRDDGTCIQGAFCKCGDNGIATKAETRSFDTFFVIERISDNIISVEMR